MDGSHIQIRAPYTTSGRGLLGTENSLSQKILPGLYFKMLIKQESMWKCLCVSLCKGMEEEQAFSLVVRTPVSHMEVPGLDSQLHQFLILASY